MKNGRLVCGDVLSRMNIYCATQIALKFIDLSKLILKSPEESVFKNKGLVPRAYLPRDARALNQAIECHTTTGPSVGIRF